MIDFLATATAADNGFERVFLVGHHDSCAINFMEGSDDGQWWINHLGGAQTLRPCTLTPERCSGRQLRRTMPEHHRAVLHSLRLRHITDGLLVVHAGIRPGVALHNQDPEDLLWIREEFLDSRENHGRLVVHGDTILWDGPDIRTHRVGIDTGAFITQNLDGPHHAEHRVGIDTGTFITDVLTALVLCQGDAGFLHTS